LQAILFVATVCLRSVVLQVESGSGKEETVATHLSGDSRSSHQKASDSETVAVVCLLATP
jgi:hypothetical protein